MRRTTRYPRHLAKYVAARYPHGDGRCPPEGVLTALFETLYFASLKTDEGRPCRFTVNYIEPGDGAVEASREYGSVPWVCVRFQQPLAFDARTLAKLAEAVDPTVSSLAVFSDETGRLFVWGLVDQEVRYADYAAIDSAAIPRRPGLFQATINGVGSISVYHDYSLIGSLEHNTLIAQYHDVIWSGPIHEMLKTEVLSTYSRFAETESDQGSPTDHNVKNELLARWLNAVCRILLKIQQYRHGGGLLITPAASARSANVKYRLHYDRLPRAVARVVRGQLARDRLEREIADYRGDGRRTDLPRKLHEDLLDNRRQMEWYENEVLGSVRFIASLSRVDGFVLLDRSLVVQGFGVELRADSSLGEVWVPRDSRAQPRLMRAAHLDEFGTRHRAMMRYCFEMPGTFGFVISQDGDIRAIMRIGDKLVLWENINVQSAFKRQGQFPAIRIAPLPAGAPMNEVA